MSGCDHASSLTQLERQPLVSKTVRTIKSSEDISKVVEQLKSVTFHLADTMFVSVCL